MNEPSQSRSRPILWIIVAIVLVAVGVTAYEWLGPSALAFAPFPLGSGVTAKFLFSLYFVSVMSPSLSILDAQLKSSRPPPTFVEPRLTPGRISLVHSSVHSPVGISFNVAPARGK